MMSIMMMKIIVIMSRAPFDGRRAAPSRADSTQSLTDFRPFYRSADLIAILSLLSLSLPLSLSLSVPSSSLRNLQNVES